MSKKSETTPPPVEGGKVPSDYKLRPIRSQFMPFLNTRQPVVCVSTDDEERMFKVEKAALAMADVKYIYTWNASTVLHEETSREKGVCRTVRDLVMWFAKAPPEDYKAAVSKDLVDQSKPVPIRSCLFIFDGEYYLQPDSKNAHSTPQITREIIMAMSELRRQYKTIFIIGGMAGSRVPPELDAVVPSFVYPLPDQSSLRNTVVNLRGAFLSDEDIRRGNDTGPVMSDDDINRYARTLLGLNECQAQRILTESIVENIAKRKLNTQHPREFDFDLIVKRKRELSGDHEAVRVVVPHVRQKNEPAAMDKVGGLKPLKDYLVSRKTLFSELARGDGIDQPKGTFIFGMGGLGKDLVIEQAAQEMGLVSLYADMGANKNHLQGASHKSMRQMLKFAEDQAPCILVFSEFEKMMAGAMSTQAALCDGGTGNEMFATWLNWMQNRTAPVMVVGLANSLENLSQASLRAGRWDSVWFADMPDLDERVEIFKVHLKRTGWDDQEYDLQCLAALTEGFTGAEIRTLINTALEIKFLNEGPRSAGFMLKQGHMEGAIPLVHSTGKTKAGEIVLMREFAKTGGYRLANYRANEEVTGLGDELTTLASGGNVSEQKE